MIRNLKDLQELRPDESVSAMKGEVVSSILTGSTIPDGPIAAQSGTCHQHHRMTRTVRSNPYAATGKSLRKGIRVATA